MCFLSNTWEKESAKISFAPLLIYLFVNKTDIWQFFTPLCLVNLQQLNSGRRISNFNFFLVSVEVIWENGFTKTLHYKICFGRVHTNIKKSDCETIENNFYRYFLVTLIFQLFCCTLFEIFIYISAQLSNVSSCVHQLSPKIFLDFVYCIGKACILFFENTESGITLFIRALKNSDKILQYFLRIHLIRNFSEFRYFDKNFFFILNRLSFQSVFWLVENFWKVVDYNP